MEPVWINHVISSVCYWMQVSYQIVLVIIVLNFQLTSLVSNETTAANGFDALLAFRYFMVSLFVVLLKKINQYFR